MGKWTSIAGPRQTKTVEEAISKVNWEAATFVELTGTNGKPETEHRAALTQLIGGSRNPVATGGLEEVGNKYQWQITSDNYKALVEDLTALLAKAIETRPVVDKRITQQEETERETRYQQSQLEQKQREAKGKAVLEQIAALKPATAAALIVAEYQVDKSDAMTDYFNAETKQQVAIGWRFGDREDFRQLRAAADTFEPTKHLGLSADKEIEHRDNYSMGAGNYLKSGGSYATGWLVKSRKWPLSSSYYFDNMEIHLSDPAHYEQQTATAENGANGVQLSENTEKGGLELRFNSKPAPEILVRLKAHGWRWSMRNRCWYIRKSDRAFEFARQFIA